MTVRSSILLLLSLSGILAGQARLLDIVDVDGVRDNQIRGLGLVVGLAGTGDTSVLTRQMAANLLRRMGRNAPATTLLPENMAVVMVTATLPPFARPGQKLDVTVSSMGDAESLRGGTLLATQLVGFDNTTVYAIAEGPLATGGLAVGGRSGSREALNHPTVGRVPSGALVEKAVPQRLIGEDGKLRLLLRKASYATALRVAAAVDAVHPGVARAVDGRTVEIRLPPAARQDPVAFLASLGDRRVTVESRARVVINERNGTIVAGDEVVILPVAISHGNISISVREGFDVSQPNPLAEGTTVVTPKSDVAVESTSTPLRVLPGSVSAGQLAASLNALGLPVQDLVTIFQMLDAQGALQAELIIQ